MKRISLIFAFILFSKLIFSQSDIQLAISYFNNKEYDKAEIIFNNLYKKNKSSFYFDYYLDCLFNQQKYDKAEKRINKEIKKSSNDLILYVDLGYLKTLTNDKEEADKQYKYVVKNLSKNEMQISQVGNAFLKRKEYDWAEKVFEKGNEFFPEKFTTSLITVYSLQRKYDKLIDTYLDHVLIDNTQLGFVEKNFLSIMNNDVDNEFTNLLEQRLIMRIQKRRNETYNEILIWFYTEKLEYSKALIQAKALDIKNKENGVRVYRIGENAFNNSDYETADKAYSYVIKKGEFYPYFLNAKFGLLKVLYAKVENGMIKSPEEIKNVESNYLEMIDKLGVSSRTIDLIIQLAHLQAFYLNKYNDAIDLLKKGINIRGLNNQLKAKFMLELGDVYLRSSMPWDAVLEYAKIEKDFPDLEITDNAKFKKAKVYFYLGQMKWAQQQLDILKGSPSKLIANDAIYWSDFISENSDDSLQTNLKRYARAELDFYEGYYLKSLTTCDSLIKESSGASVIPFVYHLKYEIYYEQKDYTKAAENLQFVVDNYSATMWTDKAIYELATLYETKLNQLDKAKELYKKLLFDYKASIYSNKARERFIELKNLTK